MSIYTKNGDLGLTSLINTKNVSKADIRFSALGVLDELNSHIGLLKTYSDNEKSFLERIQKNLFEISAQIAGYKEYARSSFKDEKNALEESIDRFSKVCPKLTEFIYVGNSSISAQIHIARAVCRRCERHLVEVHDKYPFLIDILAYINALSDYLFMYARYMDFILSVTDTVTKALPRISERCGEQDKMNLEKSKQLINKVEAKALELGLNVVVSVCNNEGNPIAVHVMDNAFIISFDVAIAKAYTAVAFKMPTIELKKHSQPGGMFYGIDSFGGKKLIVIGGGVPIEVKGKVVAGLGVSGGSEEQDVMLAQFGIEYLKLSEKS